MTRVLRQERFHLALQGLVARAGLRQERGAPSAGFASYGLGLLSPGPLRPWTTSASYAGFRVMLSADDLATAICVAGEALAPTLLAAYPQTPAMVTRLDGTSMTFTAAD